MRPRVRPACREISYKSPGAKGFISVVLPLRLKLYTLPPLHHFHCSGPALSVYLFGDPRASVSSTRSAVNGIVVDFYDGKRLIYCYKSIV